MKSRGLKIAVTGDQSFNEKDVIRTVLDKLNARYGLAAVMHGAEERGFDQIVSRWAADTGVQEIRMPANWKVLGDSAGPARNVQMIELKPDAVVVFPGGRKTAHLKALAERAGIKVLVVDVESHRS